LSTIIITTVRSCRRCLIASDFIIALILFVWCVVCEEEEEKEGYGHVAPILLNYSI